MKLYEIKFNYNLNVFTSTTHLVIEEFPSKPGVNCSTTENGSMFVIANLVGGFGKTGSMPDCIVAILLGPGPTFVQAYTSNL